MSIDLLEHFDRFPSPSPSVVPPGPDQTDRLDDDLHLTWDWHRHRYIYRRFQAPRLLDAGCGTGVATLGAVKLNPAASVLGFDISGTSLAIAGSRLEFVEGHDVRFVRHDARERLPSAWGSFDGIFCRGLMGLVDDPAVILENLARGLAHDGLLHATFPARSGRGPIRRFRQAIDALAPPGADLGERAEIGRSLYAALRPDHPIRARERNFTGELGPSVERIIDGYYGPPAREFDLVEVVDLVESAGLRFLYAATLRPWQANLVFAGTPPPALVGRVEELSDAGRAVLIDALDPGIYGEDYRIFCHPADFDPIVPGWAEALKRNPEAFAELIPHRSGLAEPVGGPPAQGLAATYRAVNGFLGPIDGRTDALFRRIDDRLTCGEINRQVAASLGVEEAVNLRASRWLALADHGFVLLEPPELRQYVDCMHRGPVRDRLDCSCPRKWIRTCDRHAFCTLDPVDATDERRTAYEAALTRLGIAEATACARCPDYTPEDRT